LRKTILRNQRQKASGLVGGLREGRFRNQSLLLLLVIVTIGIFISITNVAFISSRNILNILQQVSVTGIVTIGMGMVLISGGIDLSVGAMISLTCSVVAKLIVSGMNPWLAAPIGLAVATLCGFTNGLIISKTRCAPFIITLGMLSVYQGIALVVTRGRIVNMSGQFDSMGRPLFSFVPAYVLVFLAICVIFYVILKYSRYGRRIYAMGGNEEAAFLSCIKVDNYKLRVYSLNGFVVGIAALVLLSRLGSANPVMGNGYELQSIAAAVIGGTTLDGGRGSVVGCFLGVLLLGIISNSLNILGVSPFYQNIVLGAIIVIAVVMSNLGRGKR
jgi:ribose/xylose/arabinose/galactoside ABC-type transport system permease subunit